MHKDNSCAIDSASLVLPLSNVTLLCSDLQLLANTHESEYVLMHTETGEVFSYDLVKRNPSVAHDDGITTTYYKLVNANIGAKDYRQCIAININSKMLKSHYLRGITSETATYLYAEIMQQNKIRCSLDSFMNGFLSDIDIKQDYALSEKYDDFNHLTESVASAAKDEYKKTGLLNRYAQKDNEGISFGRRSDSFGLPLFKIYNKQLELDTKSKDFKKAYNVCCDKSVRFEVTLRNKTQMHKFGLLADMSDKQTLSSILSKLSNFDMKKVISMYANGVVPIQQKIRDDFVKMQKVELQAFDCALALLNAYEKGKLHIDESTLTAIVIDVLKPTVNTVKKVRQAVEQAFSDFYAENEQFDDIFDFMN